MLRLSRSGVCGLRVYVLGLLIFCGFVYFGLFVIIPSVQCFLCLPCVIQCFLVHLLPVSSNQHQLCLPPVCHFLVSMCVYQRVFASVLCRSICVSPVFHPCLTPVVLPLCFLSLSLLVFQVWFFVCSFPSLGFPQFCSFQLLFCTSPMFKKTHSLHPSLRVGPHASSPHGFPRKL